MKKPMSTGWIFAAFAAPIFGLWVILCNLYFSRPSVVKDGPTSAPSAQWTPMKIEAARNETPTASSAPSGKALSPSPQKEDWRAVESLDASERQAEIADLEERIEREDAIHRLNVGEVSEADRKEYGRVFARIVELKSVALKEELGDLTAKARALESSHTRRLAELGLTPHSPSRSQ
jgi:hypothetical protein